MTAFSLQSLPCCVLDSKGKVIDIKELRKKNDSRRSASKRIVPDSPEKPKALDVDADQASDSSSASSEVSDPLPHLEEEDHSLKTKPAIAPPVPPSAVEGSFPSVVL